MRGCFVRLNAIDIVRFGVLCIPFLALVLMLLIAIWCLPYKYEFVVRFPHVGYLCIIYAIFAHIVLYLIALNEPENNGSDEIYKNSVIAFNAFFFSVITFNIFAPFSFLNILAGNSLPEKIQRIPLEFVFFTYIYQYLFISIVNWLNNFKKRI